MQKLKQLRTEKGVMQKELAELIGVTPGTYSKKEAGSLRFSLKETQIIANFFNKRIEEIFFEN